MWKSLIPDTMVVGFEEVSSVDDTGAVVMASRFEYTQPDDADLAFASIRSGTHEVLQLSGARDVIGEHRIHDTFHNAGAASIPSSEANG